MDTRHIELHLIEPVFIDNRPLIEEEKLAAQVSITKTNISAIKKQLEEAEVVVGKLEAKLNAIKLAKAFITGRTGSTIDLLFPNINLANSDIEIIDIKAFSKNFSDSKSQILKCFFGIMTYLEALGYKISYKEDIII